MLSFYLKQFIPSFISLIIFSAVQSQPVKKFSGKSYTVNEGLLVNRVVDIIEDNNGFIWISSAAGLQRFDGNNFLTISPQAGLPETNHPRFFRLKDGSVWLSYYKGISVYNSSVNKFRIIFKNPEKVIKHLSEQNEVSPLMPVVESGNLIWCWSGFGQKFIAINKLTYNVSDSFQLPAGINVEQKFKISPSGTLFFNSNKGIGEVDFKIKQFINLYRFAEVKNTIYNFYPLKNNKIIFLTAKGIYKADVITGATVRVSEYPAAVKPESVSLDLLYDNVFVAGINNQLYILNAETGKLMYRMVNQQSQAFINPGYINFCIMDHFNHIWVVSDVEGVKKIDFNKLEIKYYGVSDIKKNFSRSIYPDKEANIIITGSLFNTISVFDTAGHLLKQYNIPPYTATAEVSCIIKTAPNKYLIFVDANYSVYMLDALTWKLTPVSKNKAERYYPIKIKDNTALLFHPEGITKVTYANNKIRFEPLLTNKFFLCGLIDKTDQLWTGASGKFSILKGKNFEHETVYHLKENVVTKCIFQDNEGFIWLGTEVGLYKINPTSGAIIHVYKKRDGLADETIYSIINDADNNIWCSTNKGISCIYANGRIVNIYASDGLQDNEFNTNSYAKAYDGELFFGGVNGVNSFYPDKIKELNDEPNVLMTNIKVLDAEWQTDTAVWDLQEIKLPYTKNILSFSFTALGWYNPDIYNYQYRMAGIDKEWVNAGNKGYARYALPPGKYIFEYTATNNIYKTFGNIKYISIIITPPFWQTGWFIILMLIFLVLLLITAVKMYHKKKYQNTLRQLEMKKTIQQERERISRDLHDNIGAYTTVLMTNADKLHREASESHLQQSAKNVSENAKNIIGSLQETIWVLNHESVTITDFADRFKLYAKKIVTNLPGIQLAFKEQIEKDAALSPAEALNLFRIMQEALQNSLKHSTSKQITVSVCSNATIQLSLKDEGKGFDTKNIKKGNGLKNMHHRAGEAGYVLNIISNEEGTETILQKMDP